MKKALWQYHDDVLNVNYPTIVLTPQCEAGYIQGFLAGCNEGMSMAKGFRTEVHPAPTINRYQQGTLTDKEATELIN